MQFNPIFVYCRQYKSNFIYNMPLSEGISRTIKVYLYYFNYLYNLRQHYIRIVTKSGTYFTCFRLYEYMDSANRGSFEDFVVGFPGYSEKFYHSTCIVYLTKGAIYRIQTATTRAYR